MLVGDHEPVAEVRQRVGVVEPHRVAAGQSHAVTAFHNGFVGVEVAEVVLVGLDDQRRAGRPREALADLDRDDVVAARRG